MCTFAYYLLWRTNHFIEVINVNDKLNEGVCACVRGGFNNDDAYLYRMSCTCTFAYMHDVALLI